MNNNNVVKIHGKDYITVAGRIKMAHEACKTISITTEVIPNGGSIVIKATVTTDKGVFTGISAANPQKMIEKESPYEVAETSAVGRALGFAGFGVDVAVATADEMQKTTTETPKEAPPLNQCSECGVFNVPPAVVEFSNQNFGRTVCYKCQQTIKT